MNYMSNNAVSFVKGLGLVVLIAILTFVGNATNLAGLLNPATASIVAGLAVWLESYLEGKNGTSLFGAVRKA